MSIRTWIVITRKKRRRKKMIDFGELFAFSKKIKSTLQSEIV